MLKTKAQGAINDEEPLQAIVIADNFNNNFAPVLGDSPFALLSLVGVPLIDYTLESLAQSGVRETFLFCSSHADSIKAHVQKSKEEKVAWSASMTLHIIVSESCRSFGDALRDIDAKGLIRGYFILLGCDTISNVQLVPLLEKHKEVCKKDKDAAMTLIYKSAVPGHRAQCAGDTILLAADMRNNRVIHYQKLNKSSQPKLPFPIELFLGRSEVVMHSDLIDTHIAICSPSVLPLFADNFDFQTRDDFVKGILMNEELLSSTIYWHALQGDQYAARITNWKMYQTVSQDIVHRWVFPIVPDMGITKQQQTYMLQRNYVYRHKDVTLAKNCVLEEDVVISQKSSIGESTFITRSVIGKNCIIGANCEIYDSYLMDGCVINNKCIIKKSVLSPKCVLKSNISVDNVILEKGVEIDIDKSNEIVARDASGKLSQKSMRKSSISNYDDNSASSASEDEDGDSVSGLLGYTSWDEKSEAYSSSSDEEISDAASSIQEDENLFRQEVIDSLARGFEENLKCDNLILEINSSRYAYNISLQEVNLNVMRAIFSLPLMTSTSNIIDAVKKLLAYFKPIVANYIKGKSAMIDCLKAIEENCKENKELERQVAKVIYMLYDIDVISEDAVIAWYNDMSRECSLYKNTEIIKFVSWLQNSDSSDESDSS